MHKKYKGSRPAERGALDQALEELERKLIVRSLSKNRGNLRAAAIELGCNRGGLYKRLERLGIDLESYR